MNGAVYTCVIAGTFMMVSLMIAMVWAMAVHDARARFRAAATGRRERCWALRAEAERLAGREQGLSWAAGEFHDHVGQVLALLRSAMLYKLSSLSRHELVEQTARHAEMIMGCAEEVRQWSHGLSGTLVQRVGLRHALESHLAYVETVHELHCEMQFPDTEPEMNAAVARTLLRIVQQCLHNTAGHARASRVSVKVGLPSPDLLILEVADDGVGIAEGEVLRGPGMGLASIRERVRQLGGSVVITTGRHQGLHLLVTLNIPS
jgi:signal transduction histidine kinase